MYSFHTSSPHPGALKSDPDGDSDLDSAPSEEVPKGGDAKKVRRRRRRGVIEKRRRDRINGYLTELKRLVPAAMDKQASSKLEKAEILQLTVDHIRNLNARGVHTYHTDAAALALDYRNLGFHECVTEVSRFLSIIDSPDFSDSLKARLLNHLDVYSSQSLAHAQSVSRSSHYSQRVYGNVHGYAYPRKVSVMSAPKDNAYYGYMEQSRALISAAGANSAPGYQLENAYLAASRLACSSVPPTNSGLLSQTFGCGS